MKPLVLPGEEVILVVHLADDDGPDAVAVVMYDKDGRHAVIFDRVEQKALGQWLSRAEKHHEREDRK